MIFNYRSIPGLMFNFVEAVLNQRLSTPFGCAGFESPILRLELNWQDLILHLPYLPLCPMTEVDHQQEVELFPPKESLQVVELSPRYVPNFNLDISYWKTVLALDKSGQIPTFCLLFVCFGPFLTPSKNTCGSRNCFHYESVLEVMDFFSLVFHLASDKVITI